MSLPHILLYSINQYWNEKSEPPPPTTTQILTSSSPSSPWTLAEQINQFRNGHLLRIQIMTRSNENIGQIQAVIEEMNREWAAICELASVPLDTVPVELYVCT